MILPRASVVLRDVPAARIRSAHSQTIFLSRREGEMVALCWLSKSSSFVFGLVQNSVFNQVKLFAYVGLCRCKGGKVCRELPGPYHLCVWMQNPAGSARKIDRLDSRYGRVTRLRVWRDDLPAFDHSFLSEAYCLRSSSSTIQTFVVHHHIVD
jgi:hypothetical protein